MTLSADHFEDSELLVPCYRLKEAGADVTLASLKRGTITGKKGYEVTVDKSFGEVHPAMTMQFWSWPGGRRRQ
ncbi:DJ-1/PfpI family protein [Geoalkalibacter ferrihydriticus]|uniref:DJ-1/PfpI family protein n=1 Tax=Geoalkalibacter ferrihydriticus TaxID=392333 RepID=A0A1G9MMQ1_9BACT|nr:DJ-1/PfpI family protein [Geoalkalibacter ferrihydriticus]